MLLLSRVENHHATIKLISLWIFRVDHVHTYTDASAQASRLLIDYSRGTYEDTVRLHVDLKFFFKNKIFHSTQM